MTSLLQKIEATALAVAKAVWPFIGTTVKNDVKAIEDMAADSLPKLKAGLQAALETYLTAKFGPAGMLAAELAESIADNAIHTLGVATQGISASAKTS